MKKWVFFLSIIYSVQSYSQNWLNKIGSATHEEILDITYDNSSNIIMAGYHSSNLTISGTTLNSGGISQGLIVKTNSNGSVLWSKNIGGTGADRAYAIATDNDGNIFTTGYTSGTFDQAGILVATLNNSRDIYISKHDPNGNLLWIKTAGGPDGDTGYGIDVDSDGNVFVTGQFKGSAVFGLTNLQGSFDAENNIETYDFFISKLDPNGNFLWTKKGDAKYNDRGMSVAVDNNDHVYIGGQFSDTLTFDNTQNNQIINAGFLLKVDNDGNELWFSKMAGLQSILYDVKVDQENNPIITGDFKGNMIVYGVGNQLNANATYEYNAMVAKYNSEGMALWISQEGSENEVTSKQLTIDQHGNIFTAGLFKCRFSELSAESGTGIFYSMGYRDVFSLGYNSSGTRIWEEQYGGPKDDYCSAIDVANNGNSVPIIAGSFGSYFNTPSANLPNNPSVYQGFGNFSNYCGNPNYQEFVRMVSSGGNDVFFGKLYSPQNGPTDYFIRNSNFSCAQDSIAPCISSCLDTISFCDNGSLTLSSFTINRNEFGPILITNWENEGFGTDNSYNVNQTGNYSLLVSREDECWVNVLDSINVVIHDSPEPPLLSDSWSVNVNQPPTTTDLEWCHPDTAIIHCNNFSIADTAYWANTSGLNFINDSTIQVTETGTYEIVFENGIGCSSDNYIDVKVDTFAIHDTLKPFILFPDSTLESTDTIEICRGQAIGVNLYDSLFIQLTGGATPCKTVYWSITNPAGITPSTVTNHHASFGTDTTGNYTITAHLENLCGDTVDYFINRTIHVIVHQNPTISGSITGPTNVCPQDSIMLYYTSSGDNYTFTGPNIISNYEDSALVLVGNSNANYLINGFIIDSLTGCSSEFNDSWILNNRPIPQITLAPSHGIVCPNDSVELVALTGIAWDWVGPNNNSFSSNQQTYGHLPGYYHCVVTDADGCVMTSNFVEAKEYSTPFIYAEPEVICLNGSTEIKVVADNSAIVQWQSPLTGSNTTQIVNQSGVYYCELELCNITTLDSVTITLSEPEAIISTNDPLEICPNDTTTLIANGGLISYNWNDGSSDNVLYATAPGSYWFVGTNEYGCIDTSDIIQVNHLPSPSAPLASDTSICLGTDVTLSATADHEINWLSSPNGTSLGSGDSIVLSNIIEPTEIYLQTEDSLCPSNWTVLNIGINQSSILPIIEADTLLCEFSDLTVETSFQSGFIYHWVFPDETTSENSSNTFPEVTSSNSGIYQLAVSDSICSSDTASISIEILTYPLANLNFTNDTTICSDANIDLEAVNSTIGEQVFWSTGDSTSIINVTSSGTYYFEISNQICSIFSDSISIEFTSPVLVPVVMDTIICPGDNASLQTDDNSIVNWTDDLGNDLGISDSIYLFSINEQSNYFYYSTDSFGCQSDIATANIYVAPTDSAPPIFVIGTGCFGTNLSLNSINIPGVQFSWILPNDSVVQTNSIVIEAMTAADTGYYSLTFEYNGCYSDTNEVFIQLYQTDTIDLPSDTTICQGDLVSIQYPENLEYDWSYGSTINLLQYNESGIVTVLITNEHGCSYIDTIQVHLENCDSILSPNVFTPNGDGINDYFSFGILETKKQYLEVKNRYGNLVHQEENDGKIEWNGVDLSTGKPVSVGTYFYYFRYTDWNDVTHEIQGFLTIKK